MLRGACRGSPGQHARLTGPLAARHCSPLARAAGGLASVFRVPTSARWQLQRIQVSMAVPANGAGRQLRCSARLRWAVVPADLMAYLALRWLVLGRVRA